MAGRTTAESDRRRGDARRMRRRRRGVGGWAAVIAEASPTLRHLTYNSHFISLSTRGSSPFPGLDTRVARPHRRAQSTAYRPGPRFTGCSRVRKRHDLRRKRRRLQTRLNSSNCCVSRVCSILPVWAFGQGPYLKVPGLVLAVDPAPGRESLPALGMGGPRLPILGTHIRTIRTVRATATEPGT